MPTYLRVAGAAAVVTLALVALAVVALPPWSGGSSADSVLQGDADCSESIDSLDALAGLRFAADVEPFAGCVEQAGDVNCDGLDPVDAILLLRFAAGLPIPVSAGCPSLGEPV